MGRRVGIGGEFVAGRSGRRGTERHRSICLTGFQIHAHTSTTLLLGVSWYEHREDSRRATAAWVNEDRWNESSPAVVVRGANRSDRSRSKPTAARSLSLPPLDSHQSYTAFLRALRRRSECGVGACKNEGAGSRKTRFVSSIFRRAWTLLPIADYGARVCCAVRPGGRPGGRRPGNKRSQRRERAERPGAWKSLKGEGRGTEGRKVAPPFS